MPEAAGHSLHDTSESMNAAYAAYGNASKKRECASPYTLLCHMVGGVYCMSRSTHALLLLTLRELSQHTAVTQNNARHRPSALANKAYGSFIMNYSFKHLFFPNKIHTFAADNCIKSGNVCPPTGQLS